MFGVRCSAFASFLRLEPCFPATLEHEHVWQLRIVTQTSRYIAAGVAALAAAINDDLLFRRPLRKKLRQQFIPTVLVKRNRTGNMFLLEFVIGPRVDPN